MLGLFEPCASVSETGHLQGAQANNTNNVLKMVLSKLSPISVQHVRGIAQPPYRKPKVGSIDVRKNTSSVAIESSITYSSIIVKDAHWARVELRIRKSFSQLELYIHIGKIGRASKSVLQKSLIST